MSRAPASPAARALAAANLGLVHALARRYARYRVLSFDDLVTEGVIPLVHAAHAFDPAAGCRFSTYAVPGIARRMVLACKRRLRRPLPQSPGGGTPALDRLAAPADDGPPVGPCGADLEAALARLPKRLALVVRLKHGLPAGRRGREALPPLGFGALAPLAGRGLDAATARRMYLRAMTCLRREMGGADG